MVADSLITLCLPFFGKFPITFPFGAVATDTLIKEKFKAWGMVGHNGIDWGLPMGTEVLASADGVVISAGINGDFGIAVVLQHPWGRSLYAHLRDVTVLMNSNIKVGELVGHSGKTGIVTGPHLHFGIKPNTPDRANGYLGFVDPAAYLKDFI